MFPVCMCCFRLFRHSDGLTDICSPYVVLRYGEQLSAIFLLYRKRLPEAESHGVHREETCTLCLIIRKPPSRTYILSSFNYLTFSRSPFSHLSCYLSSFSYSTFSRSPFSRLSCYLSSFSYSSFSHSLFGTEYLATIDKS